MNNKILFDDSQNNIDVNNNNTNNIDSNYELLKDNTPETVDYNSLYHIQNNNVVNNNNTTSNTKIDNNQETSTSNINAIIQEDNNEQKNKGVNGLLVIFLIFVIVMGIIIFLFPFLGKLSLS